MKVKLSEIVVGERFRTKFEGMEELKESIKTYGLIEPIVVDENMNLIAGERRYRAHKELGLEEILCVVMSELNDLQKKEIEFEENIQRKAFTWQEEVFAKAQLHKIKQEIHGHAYKGQGGVGKGKDGSGGWGYKETALALSQSTTTVFEDIDLANGIKAFPELIKETSKSVAYKKLKAMREKILNEEMAKRMKAAGMLDMPNIIHGNCIEEMKKMEAESIDLILTDPPYGIDVGDAHTFGRMTITNVNYNDSEFETMDLLDKAFAEMYRVLKANAHMYVFFAIDKYEQIVKLLVKHGFAVHHIPLIWDKGSGSYPSQQTTFVHSYEPFLHVMKGKRKLNGSPRDVFNVKRCPADKKIHPSEKPQELLRDLIKLSTIEGDKVLDPFAGSGSTLHAAKDTNRIGIGIELNAEYHSKIIKRFSN